MFHRYTPDQINFITLNIVGRSRKEVTELFNAHFELELGINQITAFIKNRKLSSGLDCTFKPGSVPFNKGKPGGGWEPTQFKKGHKPHNYKLVGTERVNGEDYVDIKIADPNQWRAKHQLVWEEANGPIPEGHVVIFGDRNKRNFDPENLILVSRKQLSVLNKNNLIQNDVELTKTGIVVADIHSRMSELKRTDNSFGIKRKRREVAEK